MNINWTKLQKLFISRWGVFIPFFIIVFSVILLNSFLNDFVFASKKEYKASASLFLMQARQDNLMQNMLSFYGSWQNTERDLITAILNSNTLAEKVIYELNLNLPYWKKTMEKSPDKSTLINLLKGAIQTKVSSGQSFGRGSDSNSQIFIVSANMPEYEAAYDVLNGYLKALANFLKQNSINTSYFVLDPPSKDEQISNNSIGLNYFIGMLRKNIISLIAGTCILGAGWILFGEWRKNKFADLKL